MFLPYIIINLSIGYNYDKIMPMEQEEKYNLIKEVLKKSSTVGLLICYRMCHYYSELEKKNLFQKTLDFYLKKLLTFVLVITICFLATPVFAYGVYGGSCTCPHDIGTLPDEAGFCDPFQARQKSRHPSAE